jgi:heme exporter protein A
MTGKGQPQQGLKSGSPPNIAAAGLACLRGGRLLFKGVSFALSAGDALILTGPNGVGKSSLLRLLAGLLPAFSGKVERSGNLALADEHMALDPRLPLARALGDWAHLDGSTAQDVTAALAAFDLTHLADVPVRMLSTGQRRRATLARIHASRAPIWLLDEPGNGLDTASLALLDDAMATHRAAGGLVIVASHQPLGLANVQHLALVAAA